MRMAGYQVRGHEHKGFLRSRTAFDRCREGFRMPVRRERSTRALPLSANPGQTAGWIRTHIRAASDGP